MRWIGGLLLVMLLLVPRAAWPQGMPLGLEFRINTYTTGAQASPHVACHAPGSFVVVWHSSAQDGSSYGIFGQRYASDGAPLGSEFRVNSYATGSQFSASVASDSSGNFVVVWDSDAQDGSGLGVFGQRFTSSGAPFGPEFRVNTYTTSFQFSPSVASDSSGNFVVVWESPQDGSDSGIFGQRYASSGTPLGLEFRVNTFTTNYQRRPSVGFDSSDNFVVVWDSPQDGSSVGVFAQRYASSGSPLGPEFRVNTYTTNAQVLPSVAFGLSGDFIVVWESYTQDGSGPGVFGQRYASSGAPLGSEFRVNTFTTSYQNYFAVAADSSGNFVVTWQSYSQDGANRGIFGQRYFGSGAPLGPEFRVNTFTTNSQSLPSVTSDSFGNFVVVWQSDTQDGSGRGIFGQRYSQILPVELTGFTVQ